jgi:hypothetical protein
MGDRELRDLERRALSGDVEAAIALHNRRARFLEERQPQREFPGFEIELLHRDFNGVVELTPLSGTEIFIRPITEPNEFGGESIVAVVINRVPYRVGARFFYYPELGWLPFSQEEMKKAENKTLPDWTGRTRPITDYLYVSNSTLHMHRLDRPPGNREPTSSATRKAYDFLIEIVTRWVEENPIAMRQAALQDTNNQIIEMAAIFDELDQKYAEAKNALGLLIINELRLGN